MPFRLAGTNLVPGQSHDKGSPDLTATVILANLEEDILAVGYGLPQDCTPGRINRF